MGEIRYDVFLSYSRRQVEWVRVLHRNLERCLGKGRVFLDEADVGAARSWVGQVQAGLEESRCVVLVASPESMASPRVEDEWDSLIATRPEWKRDGLLHVVPLVEAPMPPFLASVVRCDFVGADETKYRTGLARLVVAIRGATDSREPAELPSGIEIPGPPFVAFEAKARAGLVASLALLVKTKADRVLLRDELSIPKHFVDANPRTASERVASAVLVGIVGDDEPAAALRRLLDAARRCFADDHPGEFSAFRKAVERAAPEQAIAGVGLLGTWCRHVADANRNLGPYFNEKARIVELDRVYVPLSLRTAPTQTLERAAPERLEDLLALDPSEHRWVTRRWVVRGDPGAGKTTLLRHLAASLARRDDARWTPFFASLPRVMQAREQVFERTERVLRNAAPVQGLAAALDQEARAGRLLLLLDGLDEVPRDDRPDAEALLTAFAREWPDAPIVVASRFIGYRRFDPAFREVDLLPFDAAGRRTFLAHFLEVTDARAGEILGPLEGDPTLWALSGNPLHLTLIALLIAAQKQPSRNRAELYRQIFELLFAGKHRDPPTPITNPAAVERALRHLAFRMTEANLDAEPVDDIIARLYSKDAKKLRAELERVPRWHRDLRPFLEDVAEMTGILGAHDGSDSDWRWWHRSFRESLAADELERLRREDLLAHVQSIQGDEGRWAEPYALVTGRVQDPDALVLALAKASPALGLRAVATAPTVGAKAIAAVVQLTGAWQERAKVYATLVEKVGDPERGLRLLDRLRQETRNGNDLYSLREAVVAAAKQHPDVEPFATRILGRFFSHIPRPSGALFETVQTTSGSRPLWVRVPAGSFRMGGSEREAVGWERPVHVVRFAAPLDLMAAPVTNAQYRAFDPAHGIPIVGKATRSDVDRQPVVGVTWYEAVSFCRWIGARLPSEAEWEYACRAGTTTRYWSGDGEADLARVGWYCGNSGRRPHAVGEKPANPWGLLDMHGNVWEWCEDDWHKTYDGAPEDGRAWGDEAASGRVYRGGCWNSPAGYARSAFRLRLDPGGRFGSLGFRPARSVAP